MRVLPPFFFLIATVSLGRAADFSDPLPRYEPAGGGFACVTRKEDFEKAEAERRDACLRIGPLFVGMPRSDAEAILGKPVVSKPAADRQAFAYSLQSDASGNMTTYAVLIYGADGRAESVQVTGAPWSGNWQFAGLMLGTARDAVVARLGAPKQTEKTEDPDTVQWNYSPWTFSFEIKADVVTSIRIAAD